MALTQISTDGVKNDAISHNKIPANAIQASELADNAVDTAAIAADAVTTAKIAAGNVTATELGTGAVTSAKLAAGAVSEAGKIADSIITGAKIGSGTIVAGNIATDAISSAKILYGNVTAEKLASNSVTTAKIADLNVTTGKLADQAVTLAKLEHGTSSNNGKFLRANNGADPTFETVNTDLVSDTSPQLGGDLDTNGHHILIDDNHQVRFGDGNDFNINHDSNDTYLTNSTGNLIVQQAASNTNGDSYYKARNQYIRVNGSSNESGIDVLQNGSVKLYYDNSKKLETISTGVAVTGDYIGDNDWIKTSKESSYDTSKSPIQQNSKTYWYTRLDDSNSIQSSQFRNLAGSGGNSHSFQSTIIPVGNMTRQSDAGSFSAYHSSTNTQATRTDLAGADDFNVATKGLSMGCLVRLENTGSNGSGVIFYGDGNTENHFFSRYKYNNGGLKIGEDTDSSDNWTNAYPTSFFNDGDWRFIVMAVATNGTLMVSINGDRLTPVRLTGTVPTPSSAHFGIQGDLYGDNAARHRFATFWWHEGVISDALVAQEYAWLKTIWTSAAGLT